MHDLYRNVLFGLPPRILGRQLDPFSLGHAFILIGLDSPLFVRDPDAPAAPTFDDIATAVWIISRPAFPFSDTARALRDPQLERQVIRWGRKTKPHEIAAARDTLTLYMHSCMDTPSRYIKDGKRRSPRVPWPLSVAMALQRNGVEESRAWNQPIAKSFAEKLALDFLDGDDSLEADGARKEFVTVKKAASNG